MIINPIKKYTILNAIFLYISISSNCKFLIFSIFSCCPSFGVCSSLLVSDIGEALSIGTTSSLTGVATSS